MNREIKFRTYSDGKINNNPLIEMDANPPLSKIFSDKDIIFMQATGCIDKNGKEIYEGDWCRVEDLVDNGLGQLEKSIVEGVCKYEHGAFFIDGTEGLFYIDSSCIEIKGILIGDVKMNEE